VSRRTDQGTGNRGSRAPRRRGRSAAAVQDAPDRTLPAWKKLLFSAIVVAVALGILEGGARLFVHVAAATNPRWEFHRKIIESVGFPALETVLVPDPVLFWALRPDLDRVRLAGRIAASSEVSFTVSTDAAGTRRMPAVSGPRRTVAVLGDSCTFGVGVNDDQTFAALLQQRLPGVRAIDLGVPGYMAYQGRLRLDSYRFAEPPAAVVVTFGFNDEAVWDNRSDLEHAALLEQRRSWVNSSRFIVLLAGLLSRPAPATLEPGQTRRSRLSDEEFAGEIRAIADWCRARQAKPVLMLWPYRVQLTRNDMSAKQRALLRLAANDNLPLVNLIPFVRAQGGDALFLDIIHANPTGHAVVAGALEPILREVLAAR
jgi:lysophospholipase L1-like esterase